MKETQILALIMVMIVVSFLGFVVENVWLAVTKGFIDNRNMCLPFLIGYGLAMLAIYILLGTPGELVLLGRKLGIRRKLVKKLLYFLLVVVCICVGEILLGKLVEYTCGFYWWDYSSLPMHITRYTTIPTSMGFAVLVTAFMDNCFMPLINSFAAWDYEKLRLTAVSLILLLTVDFIYNGYRMYKDRKAQPRWKIDTTNTKAYKLWNSSKLR